MPLSAGDRLGRYEILGPLGAGGMGEVYRARDPGLEREVALKVLPADTLTDEVARARLLREARMAAKLNHPNVCTVHEVGESDGQVYIAMELVEGDSLADVLAGGPLPAERAVRLGTQVADALAHAHERGVVHRDLKSGNVVVTPEGRAKVLDFGRVRRPLLGRAGQPRAVRMAVLPFVNLTGDPEQEYLSDGITQEMITQLGRLHPEGLSVIARSSVMRYKGGDTPVDQIGRELDVEYVLEGSARREAGRVRITAELIQVRDQTQLWADSYEREIEGILAVQSEVALRVAGALALRLLPADQARLTSARTVDPEAYDAYLKGTYYWQMLTRAELDTAERYFQLALEKDPDFAPAWAGLSAVWVGRRQMRITPAVEAGEKAKTAALKALELDDSLAAGHARLGSVLAYTDYDLAGAEREYRRALELEPNDPTTRSGYSHLLMNLRRPDEAMQQIQRALELDPLNVMTVSFHAIDLLFARRFDEALAEAERALRLQPDAPVALSAQNQAWLAKGMHTELLAFDRARIAGDPELSEAFERGYSEAGYQGAELRRADVCASRYGTPGGRPALVIAHMYVCGGAKEQALDWLEKAYEERDPNLPYLGLPNWDPLRSEPRFQDLLRRMNLPQS
jgi:TolB-like protein